MNSFTIYDERIVTAELYSGSIALRDPRDLRYHLNVFDYFRDRSADGADAISLLEGIANEIAQQGG